MAQSQTLAEIIHQHVGRWVLMVLPPPIGLVKGRLGIGPDWISVTDTTDFTTYYRAAAADAIGFALMPQPEELDKAWGAAMVAKREQTH